jgi:hypothetical protein
MLWKYGAIIEPQMRQKEEFGVKKQSRKWSKVLITTCGSTCLALRNPQSLPRSSKGETIPRQSDTNEEILNRNRTLRFRINAVEEAEIEGRARNTGRSLSALLQAGALNHPNRSIIDLKAVADLSKINGDLGRVAGWLKLWPAEKNGQGASAVEVARMMIEFCELQACIPEKMSAVVFSRKR